MTEWDYQIETYKVTMHYYETLIQSSVWPIIGIIIVLGIRWLLADHIKELVCKIKEIESASIPGVKFNWKQTKINQAAQNKSYNIAELTRAYCDSSLEAIKELRELVQMKFSSKNMVGYDKIDFTNDRAFVATFITEGDNEINEALFLYEKTIEFKKIVDESPEKINHDEFVRASTTTTFLKSLMEQRERALYKFLLKSNQT